MPFPVNMLPSDGRFGAGPSRIRPEQVRALANATELGTSHRKPPVKQRVRSIREGLKELFSLPDGFEIVLGNGGATAFSPIVATSLVRETARAAVFGEFGAKAAKDLAAAPWLDVEVVEGAPGTLVTIADDVPTADVYAYPENETSTGVVSPIYRGAPGDALTVVDATSIAGASVVDWDMVDVYYFSPQKVFGADGGLWVAVLSPEAQARAEQVNTDERWTRGRYVPAFLNLSQAIRNSKADQTLNTPAIATLVLLDEQVKWLNAQGGLVAASEKAQAGASLISNWAENSDYASMFVKDAAWRSPVVSTVDLSPEVSATEVSNILRRAGIVDIDGYRKLGRNQLRIASFPSIETSDIANLLACIDWVVSEMKSGRAAF